MPDLVPDDLADLLQRPLFGSLGTVRLDNTAQVNPMWFQRDGDTLRFTHTTRRAKYRALQANPSMSLMVFDPNDAMRYLEVRGRLIETIPDPSGSFYVVLGRRYGDPDTTPPPDSADRVILVMSIEKISRH